ncbi:uncharacterized protein CDAR_547531 [Caerostris darwini]|uniref:Gustatory receptor n=1 Tax=Caerostris darwini TaxID=1538125 RepID=A0AAV4X2E4_9ARAC|nr:uncharacterized protein CDAR_547531 [Caerostris darwini]
MKETSHIFRAFQEMEIQIQSEGMSRRIPKLMRCLLISFGLEQNPCSVNASNKCISLSCPWIKAKLFASHLYLLFSIVFGYFVDKHLIFYISGNLDLAIYLIAADLLYCRRRKIQLYINNFLHTPTEMIGQQQKNKFTSICVLMACTVVFAIVYSSFSVVVLINKEAIPEKSSGHTLNVANLILNIFVWILYALHAYIGIPMQACLFVFFCLLINERLCAINRTLEDMVKRNINCVAQIRHQRAMFCELQKTSAEVDGIFREINFIWLLKIVIRCCMSFYDILTISWSGVGVSEQSIVILDVIFDIVHFTVLCIVAGNIVDSKTYILETVSAMGKADILIKDDLGQEIQYFVSVVGHSKMAMTAANIFPLNKNLAVTLLGVIGSYSIVIYQVSNN